jgi:hypothetical protein
MRTIIYLKIYLKQEKIKMKATDKPKIEQRVYILDGGKRVYGTVTNTENESRAGNRVWILWDDLSEEVVHYPGETEFNKIVLIAQDYEKL